MIRLLAQTKSVVLLFALVTVMGISANLHADTPNPHALSDAVLEGSLEKVKQLIAAKVDLEVLDDRANPNGRYPLNWAAWQNNVEIITALLDAGADISKANKTGFTPLHHAIENGSVAAAKLLIERGADLNAANRFGLTPLQFAQETGQKEVMDAIVAAQK